MSRIHAFTNDVLAKNDAVDLVHLINKKEISSKEVVQATIERAEKINPSVRAIVEKCYEQGLETAEKSTNGFFSGLPMFYKDLTYIKGLKTFYGSQAFEDATVSNFTDPIAKKIKAIGFTTLGTSTMPEFGFTCSTEYPHQDATRNPWNTNHSVGGSSGGAAALVATGVVPIAHAADGGGSIRIPASVCGLVGLKPTRGRVLLSKLFEKELVPISTDGVITRSVRDTAQFYFEAEKYYRNNQLLPIGLVNEPLNRKLQIGFIDGVNDALSADQPTKQALQETVTLLQDLGHTLKPVQFPLTDQMVMDFKRYWALNGFLLKRFGKRLFKPPYNPDKLTRFTKGLAQMYRKHIVQTPFVISRLKKSYYDYKAFLKENQIDILLTPGVAHLTPEIGHFGMNQPFEDLFSKMEKWAFFTPYSNACGCPSISLPLGHYPAKDLPIGMLFWANHGEERLLLKLALQLEAAKPWKQIYD